MAVTTDKKLITNMLTCWNWVGEAGRQKCIKDRFTVSELIALDVLQKYCNLF